MLDFLLELPSKAVELAADAFKGTGKLVDRALDAVDKTASDPTPLEVQAAKRMLKALGIDVDS